MIPLLRKLQAIKNSRSQVKSRSITHPLSTRTNRKQHEKIFIIFFFVFLLPLCTTRTALSETQPFRAIAISAGYSNSSAIDTDGNLWVWGRYLNGRIYSINPSTSFYPIPFGNGYNTVISSESNTFAFKADGSLWGWGSNNDGSLGDGTTEYRASPVLIGNDYIAIEPGSNTTFAIKADGSLWAWGRNDGGRFGDGTSTSSLTPVLIGYGYVSVSTNTYQSFAVKEDGTLWAWGSNTYGGLGDGAWTDRQTPVQIGSGFSTVSTGSCTYAIKTDGTLWTWGGSPRCWFVNSDPTDPITPIMIGSGFSKLSSGLFHTVAIKTDGTLWAWGSNSTGRLGDGTTTDRLEPVMIGEGFIDVSAGGFHTLAIKSDGTLWVWGDNTYGQLGDGGEEESILTPRQFVMPLVTVRGTARTRPQLLIAGFDPIRLNWGDTHFKLFAIVRPGASPIQSVTLRANPGGFEQSMYHVNTYENGDQRFETTFYFYDSITQDNVLGDIFGSANHQFKMTVVDDAGNSHSFPDLEFGHHITPTQPVTSPKLVFSGEPGIRRAAPQVLGAGFDPQLVDINDTSFQIVAIVRDGLSPMLSVSFNTNENDFSLELTELETLVNGDKKYAATYNFPAGAFPEITLSDLFGTHPGQFNITATDIELQSHRFPNLEWGIFPAQ